MRDFAEDIAWIKARLDSMAEDIAEIKNTLGEMRSNFNSRIRKLELDAAERQGERISASRIYGRAIAIATAIAALISGAVALIQALLR